jgi:hypothetical protein
LRDGIDDAVVVGDGKVVTVVVGSDVVSDVATEVVCVAAPDDNASAEVMLITGITGNELQ